MSQTTDMCRICILGSLLAGCLERTKPDQEDTGTDAGASDTTLDVATSPDIAVSTRTLDFSGSPLAESTSKALTITNHGDEDLLLIDLLLEGDREFELGTLGAIRLPADTSTHLPISFFPIGIDETHGQLTITSNDPDEPELLVDLVGFGSGPLLEVAPDLLLGPVPLGCADSGSVVLSNVGTEAVIVTSASVDTPFSIEGAMFPLELAPGDEELLSVRFEPTDDTADAEALLRVETESGEHPVSVTGAVVESARILDSHIATRDSTDVLIAVDRSLSMVEEVMALTDALPAFGAELDARGADWRVALTVDDDGCINGPDLFIDNTFSSADVRAVAESMLALGSTYASNTERAFTLMEASVDRTGMGDCNEGMLRRSATLNLVGVSDEPEQSERPYTSFVSQFQSLKADPSDVSMHAIGPITAACGGSTATGFEDAATATGGSLYSICDDMETNLQSLAQQVIISDRSTFPLQAAPVVSTLVVTVDGIEGSGWHYDSTSMSVVFDASHLPPEGAQVDIEYVADTCLEP